MYKKKKGGGGQKQRNCLDPRLQAVTNFLFYGLMSSCGISAQFWVAHPKRLSETKEGNHRTQKNLKTADNTGHDYPGDGRGSWLQSSQHIVLLSNYCLAEARYGTWNEM